MKPPSTRRGPLSRLTHPQTTVRWRLTLLYGGLFLVSGSELLAVTYSLVARSTSSTVGSGLQVLIRAARSLPPPVRQSFTITGRAPSFGRDTFARLFSSPSGRHAVGSVIAIQRGADLHQLEVVSAIALALMAVFSMVLGWMIAGRVLQPLRMITATTREISEKSLHRRLAISGPRDELRQLADTIDDLLERLEAAFEGQRRFVANASHELRTPLTAARAMLELAITDPKADVESVKATCRDVLSEQEHQEQLIDALLALAQGQRGLAHRQNVDLAAIVGDEVSTQTAAAHARDLDLVVKLEPAVVLGEKRLIERLVSNLVENAMRHNLSHGEVVIEVGSPGGRPTLQIANTGPEVPGGDVDRLLQPFQRFDRDRVGHGDGLGLGLSIVAAIAEAHGAALRVEPREGGGLQISVAFPRQNGELTPADGVWVARSATIKPVEIGGGVAAMGSAQGREET